DGRDFLEVINPESLKVVEGCKAERGIENFTAPAYFQFMRTGYFCIDPDSTKEKMIFNRSVSLKDGFKKK
ncbi:MAG: glutamine--tRNA ligase, partial [Ruminococcus sp.]|nr:glutamine--tRNA ligase [Ruminococcus sp.]